MEDRKIIDLYLQRDEQAISATSEKYGIYCKSIAMNILGNNQDAEECVNDTYLHAWNSIPPHNPNVLSTFLGKITRNLSFNRYKHNKAEKRGGGEISLVLDELAECLTDGDSVEKAYESEGLTQAIDTFLDSLTAEKRNIFVCRYWYTESIAEIAKQFGMKQTAVSMTLSRIRGKLLDYLTERGFKNEEGRTLSCHRQYKRQAYQFCTYCSG